MQLSKLITGLEGNSLSLGSYDMNILNVSCDSRLISQGSLFIAIDGARHKGSDFIDEAIKKGAACIIVQGQRAAVDFKKVPVITLTDTRSVLAAVADRFYNHPSGRIKVIGVTGTNGKTTVTYLIDSILKEAGFSSGIIGTICYRIKDEVIAATNTTPGALELELLLSKMLDKGCDYCIMEVSSHGLTQKRVAGIDFKSAVFTNLTQDHLDYHGTMENYFSAKSLLFQDLKDTSSAIINLDSPFALRLKNLGSARFITYSLASNSDLKAEDIVLGLEGSTFTVRIEKTRVPFKTNLIGRHNISNILAGIAFALAEGIELTAINKGVENFKGAKGRLERVKAATDINIFVDYAHTPDALENTLGILSQFARSGLTVVFGCGGERDRLKRPLMGLVSEKYADRIIITSDNPRSEDPQAIAKEIASGMKVKDYQIILERKEAIFYALKKAHPGGIVLIAGKGHEDYQVFKEKTIEFNDQKVAQECLL